MTNINNVLIEGVFVQDPLFQRTPEGDPLCTFSMAYNRFFKESSGLEKEESFFEIETHGKLAETCCRCGHKGHGVRVLGRLKQNRWIDADGGKHSAITIVAEHIEFRPQRKQAVEKTE
jgi:single-strand DNA-binding protein